MSNPIPPLLSSTPPPIDEDDNKTLDNYDDDDDNNDNCDNFDKFENFTDDLNEGLSLPSTPRHSNDPDDERVTSTTNRKICNGKLENKFEELNITDKKICYEIESNDITELNCLSQSRTNILAAVDLTSIEVELKSFQNESQCNESVTKKIDYVANLETGLESLNLEKEEIELNINKKIDESSDGNIDNSESEGVVNFNTFINENDASQNIVQEQSNIQSEITLFKEKNVSELNYLDSDSTLGANDIRIMKESLEQVSNKLSLTKPYSIEIPLNEMDSFTMQTSTNHNENQLFASGSHIETNSFEADFSQFESYDSPIVEPMSINKNIETSENHDSVEQDDFDDDFDNFQHFDSARPKLIEDPIENQENSENDFGEFSASLPVQQSFSNTQTNNEYFIEKVTKVLTSVFPIIDENQEGESTKKFDKIELNLSAVERAHCLDFLYNKSNIKTSLIKSLGIDTRNILYGENWSSGVPRFAANLGFSPLEPIKPVVIDSGAISNNDICNNTSSKADSQSQNPIKESHQYNWSESATENSPTASQAHTLLLDLDQLMVMANVDNIKIDSSSSPCSSKYYDTSTKSTTNYLIFDSTQFNDSDIGGGECDDISTNKYEYDNYLFDHYLDSRTEETVSERKNETVFKKEPNESNHSIEKSTISYEKSSIISTHNSNFIESEPNKIIKNNECDDNSNNTLTTTSLPIIINNDLNIDFFSSSTQDKLENIGKHDDRQILEQIKKAPFLINSPTTYMMPLKETHIFTPSKADKPISQTTNDIIDFEVAAAAAGTVIDETVIKKEYHDIEYEPKKLSMLNMNATGENSAFELKNNVMQKFENILPLENLGPNSNLSVWDEEYSNNNSKKILSCKSFIKDSEKNDLSLYQIEKSEFKNNVSHTNDCENNSKISEPKYYLENSSISKEKSNKICTNQNINRDNILEISLEINEAHKNLNQLKNSDSFDDEFSDFQSVPINNVINSVQTAIDNDKLNNIKGSIPNSRTNTPTNMILSPAVLLPQSVRIEKHEPKIEWPEPGINPDELARIETLYPQSSHNENNHKDNTLTDDDWSDFVSVLPPPSTQSSLNTIYCPKSPSKVSTGVKKKPKYDSAADDDEWSDFVSNVPTSKPKPLNINLTVNSQHNYKHTGINENINNFQNASTNSNLQTFSTSTSQQHASQNFVPKIPTGLKSNFVANNKYNLVNNKMSQYLLNNCSSNEPKKFVQMNTSLKPIDFIPNHHQQTFNNQFKNINNHNNNNNITTKSNNSVSLIPNLGFISPIQNCNSTKSKNQFSQNKFMQKK